MAPAINRIFEILRIPVYWEALLPAGKPLQYLLPAHRNLFSDAALVGTAPLYPKFLLGLENAITLVGAGFPQAIEKTGALLDKKLPANLQRE
jgi:hypothetical protein